MRLITAGRKYGNILGCVRSAAFTQRPETCLGEMVKEISQQANKNTTPHAGFNALLRRDWEIVTDYGLLGLTTALSGVSPKGHDV